MASVDKSAVAVSSDKLSFISPWRVTAILVVEAGVRLPPELRQTVKTLFAVR